MERKLGSTVDKERHLEPVTRELTDHRMHPCGPLSPEVQDSSARTSSTRSSRATTKVTVIDDLSTGRRENVNPAARLVEHDIREPFEIEADTVFHLAAQADVVTSVERPTFDAEVNVIGLLRVLEAAGDAQVVFTSTGGAIYGECERPAREDDPRLPMSPYGTSKLAGEEYLATWNRLHGSGHVSLRLGNVYGPRQQPKLEGGVIAIFLDRMGAGEETVVFGDGLQSRDFVHVGDVARACSPPSAPSRASTTSARASTQGSSTSTRCAAGDRHRGRADVRRPAAG